MSELFRKESLERLSSPERLDQLMQVINPKAWVPLTAMGSLVVVAGLWSVFGRIPLTVTGQGILLQPRRVVSVQALGQGRIISLNVKSGDVIKEGDILGTIDQSSLRQQLAQEQQKLADLLNQNENTTEAESRKRELERGTLEQRKNNLDTTLQRESIIPVLREKNLELLEKNRLNLENSLTNLEKNVPLVRRRSIEALEEQRNSLNERIRQINVLLPTLKERIESRRKLLEKQLITGDALLSAEQQLFENISSLSNLEAELSQLDVREAQIEREYLQGLDNINNLKSKLQEIEVQRTDLQRQYLESLNRLDDIQNKIDEVNSQIASIDQQKLESSFNKANQVDEVKRKIAQLELQLADQGKIISKYHGKILELAIVPGQVIQSGTRVGSIETEEEDSPMVNVTYLADKDGQRIKAGMKVQVTPSLVKRERYGGILGTVTDVSDYPVTTEDMAAIIGNPELARQLSQEKAPIQVFAELEKDPNTFSGYRWSSSNGPNEELSPGTTTTTRIQVGEVAPISYIIPLFRSWTGLY